MLRVGLTGGLGSGKSTVGAILSGLGAYLLQADDIGRGLMQPGQAVYAAIAERFGAGVVKADGTLDRAVLARLAFAEGRLEELNAIVHPAVIARQAKAAEEIGAREPEAVVVVESALIFETRHGGKTENRGRWQERFDRLVLVTADDSVKIARYVRRAIAGAGSGTDPMELEAEARRRLTAQMPDAEKAGCCDYVIRNDGTLQELHSQVVAVWESLHREAREKLEKESRR